MMTVSPITFQRLRNQQISHTQCRIPAEAVTRLGAIQAQDYRGALWSIGLRLPDAVEADIERAIAERSIIRTWPMRGTLHFVPAADVRWMLTLLTPRIIAGAGGRRRQLELDDGIFARSKELFIKALQGGRQLERYAMYRLLEEANISTAGQRGYHILHRCAQDGVICFGPRKGKMQTFVLLDDWVPRSRSLSPDEALGELTLRYYKGHGPATIQDFAWWSGLRVSQVRAGLEMAKAQLVSEVIAGQTYWKQDTPSTRRKGPPTAYILPGFDEYLLGYKDRSAALDPAHALKVVPGNNGMFMPTIVIDGQVAGTIKRTLKTSTAVISVTPFRSLEEAEKAALHIAANKYASFIGLPASHVVFPATAVHGQEKG
jgi:hypothetical protein